MLEITYFYWLLGAFLLYAAWCNARQRRWSHAAFWALIALTFGGGDWILAARDAGNPLPAQMAGEYVAFGGVTLLGAGSATLIGLSLASVIAALAAVRVTGLPAAAAPAEGRRLLDTMGWAALLPLVLATLGGVFAASGVGEAVATLVAGVIPTDSRIACVLAYGLGMVLFTVIMGNAFAAFPVMTAGIGLPLLVQQHGAEPAILGAIGMLTGYCGTLLTPMAANFNLVPAALLELDDPNGVIRMQVATALPLMAVNLVLMAWLAFP